MPVLGERHKVNVMTRKTYKWIRIAVVAVWILLTIALGVLIWYSTQNMQMRGTVNKLVKGYIFTPVILSAIRVWLKRMVKEQ